MKRANIWKLVLIVWVVSAPHISWGARPDSMKPANTRLIACGTEDTKKHLPKGFVYLVDVDPTIRQEVWYAGNHNFVGRPIAGYKRTTVILTAAAAQALASAQASLKELSHGQ